MTIKKATMSIAAIIFCAANTHNVIQNEITSNSIIDFISLSSGDPNGYVPYTGNGGTMHGGNEQLLDLTCYKVVCVDLSPGVKNQTEWYGSQEEAKNRAKDYNDHHSNDWPPSYAVCRNESVRISGADCDNTSSKACVKYDCSNFVY